MANRGYDVVVDVDAEVSLSTHLFIVRSMTDLGTTGRSWPYRPARGP